MPEQQAKAKFELDEKTLLLFEGNLRRIFCMKITRSTFRELQNVILSCVNQNKESANFLFETLLTGQIKHSVNDKEKTVLEDVIKNFTIPARVAKEVYERGEFINIITSDLVAQQDEAALLNRIRRIDGEEFLFLSDTQNTVNIIHHFVGRLYELEKHPHSKTQLAKYKKELSVLADRLKQFSI